MDAEQTFVEDMETWRRSVNARIAFNKFIKDINTRKDVTDEVQKIFTIVDDIVLGKEKEQFIKELEQGEKFYRARIIHAEDDRELEKGIGITKNGKFLGFNDANSREPLIGISGEGRNNISGVSYLYLASNAETACMEIKSQFADLISLAEFQLAETMKVINFASEKIFQKSDAIFYGMSLGTLFSMLMFRYTQPVRKENEYRITQVISDYLRKTGIDGIAYKSFWVPDGINYTIFNSYPKRIRFCGSKVLIHKQANHSFWDLNEECEIMSNRNGKSMEWNQAIAEKHKEHLAERFMAFTE